MVNITIHLFLIPMTIALLCPLNFCSLHMSPPACLSFWIFIQAPLSIVFFCVRDVFNFQLTDGEELCNLEKTEAHICCRFGYWLHFLSLSSGSFQLGHHRIVTYGKHKYSFVPHSHAILHLLCFWTFFSFLSPPACSSF